MYLLTVKSKVICVHEAAESLSLVSPGVERFVYLDVSQLLKLPSIPSTTKIFYLRDVSVTILSKNTVLKYSFCRTLAWNRCHFYG